MFTPEVLGGSFGFSAAERLRLVKYFADAGFKFIFWTKADIKKGGVASVAESHRQYCKELGEELLGNVIGWYYLDEIAPVYWETHFNVKESDIALGYRADKAVDPDRLHFINWNSSNVTEGQKFFAEDGADEVVYTGVNAVVAVFVFGSDGVRSAVELCIETGFVAI